MKSIKKTTSVSSQSINEEAKRHEHAMIVILAYVIGFITALIAFHIGKDRWVEIVDINGTGSPIFRHVHDVKVFISEGSLFVIENNEERLVSAFSMNGSEEDGFHYRVISTNLSPKGHYLHYCVQMAAGEEECLNFVYDVEKNAIYRVINEGEQLTSAIEEGQTVSWSKDEKLTIGELTSSVPDEPWVVAGQ